MMMSRATFEAATASALRTSAREILRIISSLLMFDGFVALSCSLARAYLHSSPSGSHNNGLRDGRTARIFDVSELNEAHVPS